MAASVRLDAASTFPASVFRAVTQEPLRLCVKKSFQDLAIAFAMNGIAYIFMASPTNIAIWAGVAASIALLNGAINFVQEKERINPATLPENTRSKWESFVAIENALLAHLRGFLFALATLPLAIFVHEGGHFLMSRLLYCCSKSSIAIFALGGATSFRHSLLSQIGEYFGSKQARCLVAFGGAGFSLLVTLCLLAAAHKMSDSHLETKAYLHSWAFLNVLKEIAYALEACFVAPQAGHDFQELARFGWNPLALAVGMIALPLLMKGCLCLWDRAKPCGH